MRQGLPNPKELGRYITISQVGMEMVAPIVLGLVLVGGLAICGLFPAFQQASFWIFVLVFYLVTLVLEMFLLVGHLKNQLVDNHSRALPR